MAWFFRTRIARLWALSLRETFGRPLRLGKRLSSVSPETALPFLRLYLR